MYVSNSFSWRWQSFVFSEHPNFRNSLYSIVNTGGEVAQCKSVVLGSNPAPPQHTANSVSPEVGSHLGWHSSMCWPLRGGRFTQYTQKNPLQNFFTTFFISRSLCLGCRNLDALCTAHIWSNAKQKKMPKSNDNLFKGIVSQDWERIQWLPCDRFEECRVAGA
jgi:hypothetical protein